MRKRLSLLALSVLTLAPPVLAAPGKAPAVPVRIDAAKGADARVDYSKLTLIGPWDDRNYKLTRKDLALLAPNEIEQRDPIPAFFRVEMRRANPGLRRTGEGQYPRSALQIFYLLHKGYQIDDRFYERATIRNGAFVVLPNRPGAEETDDPLRALAGDVRVTSPVGAAESAVKIHPLDGNKVIAGSNGPGSGQKMHYSTNGGTTWTPAAALPLGSTCCDPTIDYSADGTKAYTSTLGGCGASACNVWVYRSADGGATWTDFQTLTPGDPRREITSGGISDKEFLHVDKFATSPRKDNVYLTWHDNNVLKFSRSTDFGNTWSAPLTMSSGASQQGIGSDITTDKNGNVYYFWPTITGKTTLVRKSTDGGATFATAVTVATNQDGFDFNIPAMETRRAFQYVSADVDLSNGAFANRIYVAWTDTTAAQSATAANNHGRIRVAYSSNGGTTWTVRTPHETADANTVDRFHQWLGVGSDGTVHVMFYDTRQNAARTSVDIYYTKSTDGGNSWTAPIRATTATSPHIEDSFQWGDYNGLDVLGSQVLGIFTDNRNESASSADSIDVYAASAPEGIAPAPGALLWLRADLGVTSSSGKVSAWADQSGFGNSAFMATASRQPSVVAAALNGLPVVRFGGAHSLGLSIPVSPTNFTVFVVGKNSLSTESFSMILGPGGNSPNNQMRWENGTQALFVGTGNNLPTTTSSIGNTRVYHSLGARYDGSEMQVFRDGNLISSHSFTTSGPWTLTQVGAWYSSSFMVGDLAEVLIYQNALSEAERLKTDAYLRTKYGLP